MSTYPNCRIDSHYNEDFLSSMDTFFISGFDYACEAANTFLYNLECTELDDFHLMQLEQLRPTIEAALKTWMESERNMTITSMLDSMPEKAYEKNRRIALILNDGKKEDKKEYIDTTSGRY